MGSVCITGGTGLVGNSLLRALLSSPDVTGVILLARDPGAALASMAGFSAADVAKVSVFRADVALPGCGLSSLQQEALAQVDEVIHLAADVSLSPSLGRHDAIFRTNVDGTRHLLELVAGNARLRRFLYASSAYACGEVVGEVAEDWLARPSRFRNAYEESKWRAEALIRGYHETARLPFIIVRPSIVLCDDLRLIDRAKDQAIYLFLRSPAQFPAHLCSPLAELNFICVGELVRTIMAIRSSGEIDRIYNLTCPASIAVKDILCALPVRERLAAGAHPAHLPSAFIPYARIEGLRWDGDNASRIRDSHRITPKDAAWFHDHIQDYLKTVTSHATPFPRTV